jgi:ACT domain-containing protein|tara:strand:- start:800 stop:1153 length:354 start_codon:yes stop_codon:yes gene_type:complete
MEQNRTHIAKERMLKALESSLGVVTTALKATDLSRTNYYKWLKEDKEFAQKVKDVELIAQDFVKSKFYECIKDKVPSVVIHGAKNILGMNETNRLDITSGDKAINMPVITFVETDTE